MNNISSLFQKDFIRMWDFPKVQHRRKSINKKREGSLEGETEKKERER